MNLFNSVKLESFIDSRGKLSSLEFKYLPFIPRRLYFIREVPNELFRGGHAHRELRQAFICLSGSASLLLDNGHTSQRIELRMTEEATVIGPYIWRELHNFSPDAMILVLADKEFSEDDYIRDKDKFLIEVREDN